MTALVVSRNGAASLAHVLEALNRQERPPDRLIGVDVGSVDGSAETLERAFGPDRVLRIRQGSGLGAAVRSGLREVPDDQHDIHTAERPQFLWLLRDDTIPDAGALAALLRVVENAPSLGIAGCKQRDWHEKTRLIDVGLSVSRRAERLTMIDADERDQGQYDGRSDVFAVNAAGMLVRRDVWDELGGFDPALFGPGDDLDFCWRNKLAGHRVVVVPQAIVWRFHDTDDGSYFGSTAIHRAELYTRLKHAPPAMFPVLWVWLFFAAVGQIFLGLLYKHPRDGWDRFWSSSCVLWNVAELLRGRQQIRKTQRVARSRLRELQISPREVWHYRKNRDEASALEQVDNAIDPGGDEFEPTGDSTQDFLALATPKRLWSGVGAVISMLVLSVFSLAALAPWIGAQALQGGALLPVSSRLEDLWAHANGWWAQMGAGYPAHGAPFVWILWLLGLLGVGHASQAVVLLVLAAVPLAGFGAWLCTGAVSINRWLRVFAALLWGGYPAFLIALNQGRLGAVVVHMLLPWAAWGILRSCGVAPVGRGEKGSESLVANRESAPKKARTLVAAAVAGLPLALIFASAPSLLPCGLSFFALVIVLGGRNGRQLIWALLPTVAIFLPFLFTVANHPRAFFADPGMPLSFVNAPSWLHLLGQPDASIVGQHILGLSGEAVASLLGIPVVLLAIGAVLWQHQRLPLVRTLWLLVCGGLITAYGVGILDTGTTGSEIATPFSGPALSVVGISLLLSAVIFLDVLWVAPRLQSQSWRRVVFRALVACCTALLLVAALGSLSLWTFHQQPDAVGLVHPGSPKILPATASDRGLSTTRSRTLVLSARSETSWEGSLMRGSGTSLDALSPQVFAKGLHDLLGQTLNAADGADKTTRTAIAALASDSGVDPRAALNSLGVAFVVLRPDGGVSTEAIARRLDAVPGLVSVGWTEQGWLWRVTGLAAQGGGNAAIAALRIEDGQGKTVQYLPMNLRDRTDLLLPAAEAKRRLVLAERADSGWKATLDGRALAPVSGEGEASWAQAFALPNEGGHLAVHYEVPWSGLCEVIQVLLLVTVLFLAVPTPRNRHRMARFRERYQAPMAKETLRRREGHRQKEGQ